MAIMRREPRSLPMFVRVSHVPWLRLVMLFISYTLLDSCILQAQTTSDEYQVKAAFLYHFAQLVTWPAGAGSDPSKPFLLCTVGQDPFEGKLESTIRGKQVNAQRIQIRHVEQANMRDCTMVFIGQSNDTHLLALLETLGNDPILTVGEGDGFLEAGGMIQFLIERNRIRFAINRGAAEAANLTISSQLLLLARNVVNQPKAGRK